MQLSGIHNLTINQNKLQLVRRAGH